MKNCTHRHPWFDMFRGLPSGHRMTFTKCIGCGAWLPLGPANDEPTEVQIEIRAAEIAADMADGIGLGGHRPSHCDGQHCWHWIGEEYEGGQCCYCNADGFTDECPAGYLARCIAEHDEEAPLG